MEPGGPAQESEILIGNSSSGIVESQSFDIPAVNVGERQQGRLRNPNVIDSKAHIGAIVSAIQTGLSENFRSKFKNKKNIYWNGNSAKIIVGFVSQTPLDNLLLKKDHFDKS